MLDLVLFFRAIHASIAVIFYADLNAYLPSCYRIVSGVQEQFVFCLYRVSTNTESFVFSFDRAFTESLFFFLFLDIHTHLFLGGPSSAAVTFFII